MIPQAEIPNRGQEGQQLSMELNEQKAQSFIKRLLSNPALSNFQTLQKEEHVFQFIVTNQKSLYPTLSSLQFFPGKTWEQIQSILFDALSVVVNEILSSEISALLSTIDFSFIAFLRHLNYPVSKCRDQIFEFLSKLLVKNEARKAFEGAFTAIKLGITDKYIEFSFARKEYIQFELTKVQRLKMSKEEIKNLVKATLFLKPGIHLLTSSNMVGEQGVTSDIIQRQFAEKSLQALGEQLNLLPPELVKSSVDSNLSFLENPDMGTTSRIVSVFSTRCKNYTAFVKVERGAEHPDKSWFNIARRNYKYHGFDIKMLDELYRIATENGW
jgi:hypothetical protein